MITDWNVANFKSIYENTTIELAPLTVFAGANSSGKSTVIQSILLTAQTIQSPVHSKSVVLNGHILRMGAFDDIASNSGEAKSVKIGFGLRPLEPDANFSRSVQMQASPLGYYGSEVASQVKKIDVEFAFSAEGCKTEAEMLQLQPVLMESRIRLSLKSPTDEKNNELHIVKSAAPIEQRATQLKLSEQRIHSPETESLRYEVKKPTSLQSGRRYSLYGLTTGGTCAGAILNHFIPTHLSIVYDTVAEQARVIIECFLNPRDVRTVGLELFSKWEESVAQTFKSHALSLIKGIVEHLESYPEIERILNQYTVRTALQNFKIDPSLAAFFTLLSSSPPIVRRIVGEKIAEKQSEFTNTLKAERKPQNVLTYAPLSNHLEFSTDYIRGYFTANLKYLGPLRDEPKSIYPLSGTTDSRDVGYRGEHTAAVLETHKKSLVNYIPSSAFIKPTPNPTIQRTTLMEAVSDWLSYMGVVQNLQTTDKGKLGHELKVCTSHTSALHELTHVGVGVSQVLPILVLALLADSDSTLIFEQPELHLHPKVQTRLADFFVAMTMTRKQCIVETHSEYLINRLRYLSAIGEGHSISSQVILYFVENEGGHSRYQPVRINEFGVIPDWPKGFFDENEENAAAILRAGMEKRRKTYRPNA